MKRRQISLTRPTYSILLCCLIAACSTQGGGISPKDESFAEVEAKLLAILPQDYSEEVSRLGDRLVDIVSQQNPHEVSDKEVDDLTALLRHANSSVATAGADALSELGPRAKAAAPALEAAYWKEACKAPVLQIGPNHSGAFQSAYQQITMKYPAQPTLAECQKLVGTNDPLYWLPGHS